MGRFRTPYDRTPAHQNFFDPTAPGQPSSAIVRSVSAVADRSPAEITPLYEAIELDALERLLEHAATSRCGTPVALEFRIEGWDVVVSGDGAVRVYDSTDAPEGERGVGLELD